MVEMDKFLFFGNLFDCDDNFQSIRDKIEFCKSNKKGISPYQGISEFIKEEFSISNKNFLGDIPVESWVSSFPSKEDVNRLTPENMIKFMENGRCLQEATKVKDFISKEVLPRPFCLIGVDHCISGGAIEALTDYYGTENLLVIVFDAHTDAIPNSITLGAIHYDMEHNENSVYDMQDELLYNRKDSYNSSSFLYDLMEKGSLSPNNLIIVGVCDYPPKEAFKIKDKRIVMYVNAFVSLKRKGVKIFTRKDIQLSVKKIKRVIERTKTPYIYISIDMDIGAIETLNAVRFKNRRGLKSFEILKLVDCLKEVIKRNNKELVGIDLMEFDPRLGEESIKAYKFAVSMLKKLFKEV